MSLCKTCRHYLVSDDGAKLCHRNVPRAGTRDRCSEYRIDPASEPPDDEEPVETEW